MKIFNDISKNVFTQFQQENMDPALALIGDGIKKEGLRNQVCARLLGYRAFEAISFDQPVPVGDNTFSFGNFYEDGDEVDLTLASVGYHADESDDEDDDEDHIPTRFKPYPQHANYLNDMATVFTKLKATPLLLSILPVLIDDKTPWQKDVLNLFEDGLKHHKPRYPGENAPCYTVHEESFGLYTGYLEMVKLLSETGAVPENLAGHVKGETDRMWINQHLRSSLEKLNAEVKRAFDEHLQRIDYIQRHGYGESAPFKLLHGDGDQ